MATLAISDAAIHLTLTRSERWLGFHGDLAIARSDITAIEHVDDLWRYLRGLRVPGTGCPGVLMLGTTRGRGFTDFCVVYGHRPGTIVSLLPDSPCGFDRVLVSDPRLPLAKR